MPFTYTFSKISKLGEHDEKYGTTYWGEPNEDLTPVKFNSMNQDITENDTITAEERAERVSTKGTNYYQLKKVKVVDSGSQGGGQAAPQATQASQNPGSAVGQSSQLDRIEKQLSLVLEGINDLKGVDDEFRED